MPQLTIDLSGSKGLAPRFWGDLGSSSSNPENRILGEDGQMAEGIYVPFFKRGYLAPGNGNFNQVSGINDVLYNVSHYRVKNNVLFFAGGKFVDFLSAFSSTSAGNDTTFSANDEVLDIETYQINGAEVDFFVYRDASISKLDIRDDLNADNSWLRNTVSGGFAQNISPGERAFMENADNGFCYLMLQNTVHKIDGTTGGGTNGTVSQNVLTFPGFFDILDAQDFRGNMYIAIKHVSASDEDTTNKFCGVYVWDRFTSVVRMRDFIYIPGTRNITSVYTSHDGNLMAITESTNGITQLRQFTGQVFKIVAELGFNELPTTRDCVQVVDTFTLIQTLTGKLFMYGSLDGQSPNRLYLIGDTGATEGGAILWGLATGNNSANNRDFRIYTGYDDGNKRLAYLNVMGDDSETQAQGDIYTLVRYLPPLSTVKDIVIYMAPNSVSGSTKEADVKIYFNQSTTATATKAITLDDIAKGFKHIEVNKPFVNAIQFEIEYNTSQALQYDKMFAPAFAIVNYELTGAIDPS